VVEAKDLLEVIDDRSQLRSTVVVSQLPVENWHAALAAGDPTLADAILDRLVVHHAHRLELQGSSMRRRQPPPTEEPPVAYRYEAPAANGSSAASSAVGLAPEDHALTATRPWPLPTSARRPACVDVDSAPSTTTP
jgi:hypothetical protein